MGHRADRSIEWPHYFTWVTRISWGYIRAHVSYTFDICWWLPIQGTMCSCWVALPGHVELQSWVVFFDRSINQSIEGSWLGSPSRHALRFCSFYFVKWKNVRPCADSVVLVPPLWASDGTTHGMGGPHILFCWFITETLSGGNGIVPLPCAVCCSLRWETCWIPEAICYKSILGTYFWNMTHLRGPWFDILDDLILSSLSLMGKLNGMVFWARHFQTLGFLMPMHNHCRILIIILAISPHPL